ncbi:hypothetical protein BH11MYX4_BH11MYX4_05160 [soil metagenome]
MSKLFNVGVRVEYEFEDSFTEEQVARAGRIYDASLEAPEYGEDAPRTWAALSDSEKAEHLALESMMQSPSFLGESIIEVAAAAWGEEPNGATTDCAQLEVSVLRIVDAEGNLDALTVPVRRLGAHVRNAGASGGAESLVAHAREEGSIQ